MSIKQAIEALEELVEYAEEAGFDWSLDNARAALAALRSMPAEPVAWGMCKNGLILDCITPAEHESYEGEYTVPLFGAAQTAPMPVKIPIPPPQADPLDVVYAEGWNACCDTFFGGLPTPEPLVVTITERVATQHTEAVRQALTDPENQPNQLGVTFGMRGPKMYFAIGHQSFTLDYAPEEPGEFEFMRDMLTKAMSVFTPDVKPEAVRMSEAENWPTVPANVMTCIHAYGDSRADDDGFSSLRIGAVVYALREWAGSIRAVKTPAARLTDDEIFAITRQFYATYEVACENSEHENKIARAVEQATAARLGVTLGDV